MSGHWTTLLEKIIYQFQGCPNFGVHYSTGITSQPRTLIKRVYLPLVL